MSPTRKPPRRHRADTKTPRHIAIIMDGNGRWARRRGRERTAGHLEGQKTLEKVVQWCIERGVRHLTVYAFSTENWRRPEREVRFLMGLIRTSIAEKTETFMRHGIRLLVTGDLERVPKDLRDAIHKAVERTKDNSTFDLCVAFNYGGRDEIVRAAKRWALSTPRKDLHRLDEQTFRSFLDHPELPDPDLLIRPGGEFRVSNFLLWQISYTELWFTPTLWPDFSEKDLDQALRWYRTRHRRFGGL